MVRRILEDGQLTEFDVVVVGGGPAGSACAAELARGGWSFAVLSDGGVIVASAFGVPPPWIKDIGGAEAWAVL